MNELTFIVTEDSTGGYNARAAGYSIFTQADTREDLIEQVRDAVRCHFDSEDQLPKIIHLHYAHDEVVAF